MDLEEIDLKNADGNYQTSKDANFDDTVGATLKELDTGHAADSSWQGRTIPSDCWLILYRVTRQGRTIPPDCLLIVYRCTRQAAATSNPCFKRLISDTPGTQFTSTGESAGSELPPLSRPDRCVFLKLGETSRRRQHLQSAWVLKYDGTSLMFCL